MIENNGSKLVQIVSLATFLLSILGFIFGDNIVEKLSGPELFMNSTKVKMNLPDKLINDSYIPEYYRYLEITNEGSAPSKNLRLIINTDGDIYDYKIDSAEKINELKITQGKITTELQRLSPNAKIFLELWLNNNDTIFEINYADDNNSGVLEIAQNKKNNKAFDFIMIGIAIISTAFLVYSKINSVSKQKIKEVNLENIELENEVNTMIERLKEENSNNNKEVVSNVSELYKRLEDFIKSSSKL